MGVALGLILDGEGGAKTDIDNVHKGQGHKPINVNGSNCLCNKLSENIHPTMFITVHKTIQNIDRHHDQRSRFSSSSFISVAFTSSFYY